MAALELRSVERQIPKNNKDHHTQEMGLTKLILRRGQDFSLKMTFNRPFQPQKDHLTFVAETGELALPSGSSGPLKTESKVFLGEGLLPPISKVPSLLRWDPRTLTSVLLVPIN